MEALEIAAEYLRGAEGEQLAEVADMLDDIAAGKWTLVNEGALREWLETSRTSALPA